MSKHSHAYTLALQTALHIVRQQVLYERAIDSIAAVVRELHDDFMLRLGLKTTGELVGDIDDNKPAYYGDEPCNCAMCRPIGSRIQQYDC